MVSVRKSPILLMFENLYDPHANSWPSNLKRVPGNQLEALKWDRAGQHSIRLEVASRWRICFVWQDGSPDLVEIVD